jgi:PKD repeat protein
VPDPLSIAFFVSPTSGEAPLEVSYACEAFGGVPDYAYDLQVVRALASTSMSLAAREGTLILTLPGTYAFTCTVTDDAGSSIAAERTVVVTTPRLRPANGRSAQSRSSVPHRLP